MAINKIALKSALWGAFKTVGIPIAIVVLGGLFGIGIIKYAAWAYVVTAELGLIGWVAYLVALLPFIVSAFIFLVIFLYSAHNKKG